MCRYKRTALGNQELLQRSLHLSARVRTLLLLLESDDLKQLSSDAFHKIANADNYQKLIDLELIIDTAAVIDSPLFTQPENLEKTQLNNNIDIPEQRIDNEPFQEETSDNTTIPVLDLIEIKNLMQQTLRQYCGLMAKSLIHAIEQSNSTQEIRQYQGKWLTSLFETRIPRQQLNALLQQINHSMDKIEILSA